jgi:hypothetical protein
MKVLAVILSIIVMVFSTTVCCPEHDAENGSHPTEQGTGHFPQDDDCSGACSPFCKCAACIFASEILSDFFQIIRIETFVKINSYYSQLHASPISKGIWQPPRF